MRARLAVIAVVVVAVAVGGAVLVATDDDVTEPPPRLETIPGATESGVNTSLAETHDGRVLSLDSFTYEASTVRLAGNGLVDVRYELRADTETGAYLAERTVGSTTVTTYHEDGTSYQRRENASGTFYSVTSAAPSPLESVRRFNRTVRTVARGGNFTFAERVTVDGQEGYRYVADGVDPTATGMVPAENVSAELVVGATGTVRVFELSYAPAVTTERDRITVRSRFSALNTTTVSKPGWVDDAATQRSQLAVPDANKLPRTSQ